MSHLARVVAVAASVMVVVALAQLPSASVSAQGVDTFDATWTVAVPSGSQGGTATVTFASALDGCDDATGSVDLVAGMTFLETQSLVSVGTSRVACEYTASLSVPAEYETPSDVLSVSSTSPLVNFGTLVLVAVVTTSTTTTTAVAATATTIDTSLVVHDNVVETAPEIIAVIATVFPFALAMAALGLLVGMATRSFLGVIRSSGSAR